MKLNLSKKQKIENFKKFKMIQDLGVINMYTEAYRVLDTVGMTRKEWYDIIDNYREYESLTKESQ